MQPSLHGGEPSCAGAFTTVLITGSHASVEVCCLDVPLDLVTLHAR
jgi:hypothetical protein